MTGIEAGLPEAVASHLPSGFGGGEGSMGRGGMRTKLEAARIATRAGVAVVIANGKRIGMLSSIASGRFRGTLFLPQRKGRET